LKPLAFRRSKFGDTAAGFAAMSQAFSSRAFFRRLPDDNQDGYVNDDGTAIPSNDNPTEVRRPRRTENAYAEP
jgi:hypothetical protein